MEMGFPFLLNTFRFSLPELIEREHFCCSFLLSFLSQLHPPKCKPDPGVNSILLLTVLAVLIPKVGGASHLEDGVALPYRQSIKKPDGPLKILSL